MERKSYGVKSNGANDWRIEKRRSVKARCGTWMIGTLKDQFCALARLGSVLLISFVWVLRSPIRKIKRHKWP